ncbi:unnamed protein product, partial [Symbiodinium necroappetens]
ALASGRCASGISDISQVRPFGMPSPGEQNAAVPSGLLGASGVSDISQVRPFGGPMPVEANPPGAMPSGCVGASGVSDISQVRPFGVPTAGVGCCGGQSNKVIDASLPPTLPPSP